MVPSVSAPYGCLPMQQNVSRRSSATAVIWKILMVAETTFRRLNADKVLKEVYNGTPFVDGIPVNNETIKDPPESLRLPRRVPRRAMETAGGVAQSV